MNPHYFSVRAGAAYLDAVKPDWQGKIDISLLNMRMPDSCILGQVFGNFDIGQEELKLSHKMCHELGFGLPANADEQIITDLIATRAQPSELYYAELTAEWLRYFYDHLLSIYEEEQEEE